MGSFFADDDVLWEDFEELVGFGEFVSINVFGVAELLGLFDGEFYFFGFEAGEWEVDHVVSDGGVSEWVYVVLGSKHWLFECFGGVAFGEESFD